MPDSDYDAFNLETMGEHHWRRFIAGQFAEMQRRQDKTNGRLSKLEQWRFMAMGALAVISAIVVPLFLKLLNDAMG